MSITILTLTIIIFKGIFILILAIYITSTSKLSDYLILYECIAGYMGI